MDEILTTEGISHSKLTMTSKKTLTTKDGVAQEIKKCIENLEIGQDGHNKSYVETLRYIVLLYRPLSYLELAWFQRQYVITLLQLWLKKSLGKAFEYLNDEGNDISQLSTVLTQLNSINSFEDIGSIKLNDVESPLFNLCDRDCRYFQLILEQEDLLTNTPRFTAFVNCYFKQFKTSCIDKVFSRCLNDIVTDTTNGEKHGEFIEALTEFLSNVNEEKNLKDNLEKDKFLIHYVKDENKTGRDIIKQLVGKINSSSETEQGGTVAAKPEWLQTFLSNANSISDDEWTPKLQLLTKETCKKILLPETEIKFKEEDGKQTIYTKGVVIYVSQMIAEMNRLKHLHPDVEEIHIVGLQSVHIDCDMGNETWHGINIGIVTDKLIVDDNACWDVSGKTATTNPSRGKPRQPSESGGNVHVVCNQIINGQKWTIVSDGGDGSDGYKWKKKEFENSFPSMSTDDNKEAMKTVLTTLEEMLPNENRSKGENILPGHEGNFIIEGKANDDSTITVIFYGGKKEKQTLILISRIHVGEGGYGGDITLECFGSGEEMIPLTGSDTRRKPLTNVRMGVYEASGSNGKKGKVSCDVALIHKFVQGSSNNKGDLYGFDEEIKIDIDLDIEEVPKKNEHLYVKYEDKRYAGLSIYDYDDNPIVILVEAFKKKAVIRKSLVQHLDQIDEWNQLTESIQKMLSNPTEHHSSSIDEIINEMDNKVHQFHQLMTQRQRHKFEEIEQEQYVRPAINPSSDQKSKIIGRRPVFLKQLTKEMNTKFLIYCLEELPTDDDDVDNALHCFFGQLNKSRTKFLCKNTNKFRVQIAKHILEKDLSGKIHNGVFTFVLRVNGDGQSFPAATVKRNGFIESITNKYQQLKGMETQILRWLNHNDDYDIGEFLDPEEVDKWNKAWEAIGNPKTIKADLFKEQKDCWRNDEDLKQEYAKYIRSSTGTLGLAELEMLAKILRSKIHVYTDNKGSLSFRYMETLNYNEKKEKLIYSESGVLDNTYFILYRGKGRWQRIQPNYNLNLFFENFTPEDDEPNKNDSTYFTQLKSWIDGNKEITNRDPVNSCIDKFNPKNEKTPDKLSQLVFERLNKPNIDVEKTKELVKAICSLAEWVDCYNNWNISPLFYLAIVEKYTPQEWEYEFLLLEMETKLEKPWENKTERDKWRKEVRERFICHDRALPLLTKIAMDKENNDIFLSLNFNKLLRMLTVCKEENFDLIEGEVYHSAVINLFYKHRSKFWERKVNEWLKINDKLKDEKKNEYVNLLLEIENKNDIDLLENLCNNTTNAIKYLLGNTFVPGHNSISESRNVNSIIDEMKKKYPNYKYEIIEKIINESKLKRPEFKILIESNERKWIEKKNGNKIFLKEEQSKPWIFELVLKKANKVKRRDASIDTSFLLKDNLMLEDFMAVFDYAVERIMEIELRDAQRVAIMTLLVHSMEKKADLHIGKTLAQVSTGEGKSIIVAGVAIGFTLFKTQATRKGKHNKVDVITSNNVLAIRDSTLSVAEGGLKELYEFFNVTVANNCNQFIGNRNRAYNMDVVYGQLANFQRDYLLDTFYKRNIRGDRPNYFVIIDEADCMLLDRGSNVLYLSHDIPGMEMLESLYVFIWEKIQNTSPDEIKSAVLKDLYGQINEEDLNSIHAQLGGDEMAKERSEIWGHLTEKKVINRQGRLLINNVDEITEEMINYVPTNETLKRQQLNSKIRFYFRTIIERERRIRIPDHLLDFVDRNLDTWLENARRALELKQDEDYVIDCDRSDTSPDLNPQVIIIDSETGTDQFNSQWDGALHQFLQLKEGCKLTMQSLKAVFISNAKFIKYACLAGVSGTLGSEPEQELLKKEYECNFFTVPTAFYKNFSFKSPKLFKTKESWRNGIIEETRRTITNRSIVIFCRSIKQVNKVYQYLKFAIPVLRNNKRIHRYTRDYEKFEFESKNLDEGHVIVATNLAGRGTDIKLSETLEANGGLHICLTYFPENERVEEQAMGRAARKGKPGSGVLILCETQMGHWKNPEESSSSEEWDEEKIFVMKEERAWKERQRILSLKKDFEHIKKLEILFKNATSDLSGNVLKSVMKKTKNETVLLLDDDVLLKVIHDSIVDKWALWLDETEYDFKYFGLKQMKFKSDLNKLIDETPKWMTPARRVTIARNIAMKKSRKIVNLQINSKKKVIDILNSVMDSPDNFCYPAAFYYHAFILLTKSELGKDKFKKEKEEFIRTLRHAETILNEHFEMQISFIQIHQLERKPASSFYTVDGYREQKQNNIKILEYFLRSIQWMLGSRCSILNLQKAGSEPPKVPGLKKFKKKIKTLILTENIEENKELKTKIPPEKAGKYFSELIKKECIVCELNHASTIPNNNVAIEKLTISSDQDQASKTRRSEKIKQIAEDYGASDSLEEKLVLIFDKALNEGQIEKELKQTKLIPCTRKALWEKMKETRNLIPLKECLKTDCVIISEEDTEQLEKTFKLDRKQAIKLEFGVESFDKKKNRICVLYNPTHENQQELEKAKKIMFSKTYVTTQLLKDGYRKWKEHFESNKIAQIDLGKLEKFESISQLGTEDFNQINIDQSEHKRIWDELVHQKIINEDGYLKPDYDFTKDFSYPDCPAYAEAVMRMVSKKFAFELVIQQWLKFEENPYCLKAINFLPRKPYRDMLADLMAAHVISGARVTENFAIDFKEEVKKITESDQERKCLIEYLTSRQSVLTAKPITPEFFLDFIERDINFASELYIFRLVGFDRVIDIKDRKWTIKRFSLMAPSAILASTVGVASIGVGGVLTFSQILPFKLPFGLSKNLFFMGGSSDILYAVETILSRKKFTWADYKRQRIRSAMGKMEPIAAIKAIWKLRGSSNQSFSDANVTNKHIWNKRTGINI